MARSSRATAATWIANKRPASHHCRRPLGGRRCSLLRPHRVSPTSAAGYLGRGVLRTPTAPGAKLTHPTTDIERTYRHSCLATDLRVAVGTPRVELEMVSSIPRTSRPLRLRGLWELDPRSPRPHPRSGVVRALELTSNGSSARCADPSTSQAPDGETRTHAHRARDHRATHTAGADDLSRNCRPPPRRCRPRRTATSAGCSISTRAPRISGLGAPSRSLGGELRPSPEMRSSSRCGEHLSPEDIADAIPERLTPIRGSAGGWCAIFSVRLRGLGVYNLLSAAGSVQTRCRRRRVNPQPALASMIYSERHDALAAATPAA